MPINLLSAYLFMAVLMTLLFCSYVLVQSNITYMKYFFWLCLGLSIYLLGYMMELQAVTLENKIFWNQIQYFAVPFIPTLWLMVSVAYMDRERILTRRSLFFLFIIPILTLIFRSTNHLHGFFYTSLELTHYPIGSFLSLGKGFWYYIQTIHNTVVTLLIVYLFYKDLKSNQTDNNKRTLLLLASVLLPYVGMTLILSETWVSALDYTALLLPLSIIIIMITIYTYDFLEVKSIARARIFEDSMDAMLIIDVASNVLDYNRAAKQLFNKLNIKLTSSSLNELLKHHLPLKKKLSESKVEMFQTPDQSLYEIITWPMLDKNKNDLAFIKIISDVTEREKMQSKLEKSAQVDELSQLYNRRYFMEQFKKHYREASRQGTSLTLIMMDLDRFKSINDTYGHAGGDLVIKEFGQLLTEQLPDTTLGRLGGEEFAVLLPQTSLQESMQVAEHIRKSVETKIFLYKEVPIHVTISQGISFKSVKHTNPETMLLEADNKLYQAKREGRNKIVS